MADRPNPVLPNPSVISSTKLSIRDLRGLPLLVYREVALTERSCGQGQCATGCGPLLKGVGPAWPPVVWTENVPLAGNLHVLVPLPHQRALLIIGTALAAATSFCRSPDVGAMGFRSGLLNLRVGLAADKDRRACEI